MRLKLKRLFVPFSESEGSNFIADVWIVSEVDGTPIGEVSVPLPFIPGTSKGQTLDQLEVLALTEARKHVGIAQ